MTTTARPARYTDCVDLGQLAEDLRDETTTPVLVIGVLQRLITEVEQLRASVDDLWGEGGPLVSDEREVEEDFAVIAFLGVTEGGQTDEATQEAHGLDAALDLIREVVTKRGRQWHAITLVHIEDYPKSMEGAVPT